MLNSLIITAGTVACLIVIGSLCAYTLARRRSRSARRSYFLFVLGIIVPFQLGIVPLYVAMRNLGLIGSYYRDDPAGSGSLTPVTVFLYTGFIRTLPRTTRRRRGRRRRHAAHLRHASSSRCCDR